MAVYHRTRRLQIYGDKPEVTTLFGNRYQMVVRCEAKHDTEAWYNANKNQIFADFGTLYDAEMAIDGIEPRTGEAYDNMVLVSNEAGYAGGEYVVTFVYQTLTADFVQEAADKVDYELNGLRRVTRPLIAKDGSDYYNVPDAMVVEGAGTDAVNGVYFRDGDSGGKPRYTLVGGTTGIDAIYWSGSSWFIEYDLIGLYYSGDDVATPDLVVTWVSSAGNDVPIVRRATWADIEAAGIDPSTVPVLSGSEKVIGTSTISHTEHGYDTVTLTLASAVEDAKGPNEGGYVRIVETWVEAGILNASKEFADDGLLYVTFISQGSKFTPTALNASKTLTDIETEAFQGGSVAPVRFSRVRDINGFRKFEVTVMLQKDGSALTSGTEVQSRRTWENYEYPGYVDTSFVSGIVPVAGGNIPILVEVTETMTTDSDLTSSPQPFSIKQGCFVNINYIPTETGLAESINKSFGTNYLAGSIGLAGSNATFLGMEVSSIAGGGNSNPTYAQFLSTSSAILDFTILEDFVTDEGVQWYRIKKTTLVGTFGDYD